MCLFVLFVAKKLSSVKIFAPYKKFDRCNYESAFLLALRRPFSSSIVYCELPDDRPITPRHFSVWCSQRDVADMLEKCIAAPDDVRYDVFYAVSNNRRSYRDLAHAREVLGDAPQDIADSFAR